MRAEIIEIDDDEPKFQILDKPKETVDASQIEAVMEKGEAAKILRHIEEAEEEKEKREDAYEEACEEALEKAEGKPVYEEDIEELVEQKAAEKNVDQAKIDEANRLYRDVFNRVAAVNDKLWQCEEMHASEYERGGFQHSVASRLIDSAPMATTVISVDVNTNKLPNKEEQRQIQHFLKDGEKVETLREEFGRQGVEIPGTIRTKVYIIAPKDMLEDAASMVRAYAAQSEESMTHRGLYFNDAVAYQSLGQDAQSKIANAHPQRAGWYEIDAGVFFTIDKDMFDRAKAALVAQKPKQPSAPRA